MYFVRNFDIISDINNEKSFYMGATIKLVNKYLEQITIGEAFTSAELLKFGSRANIDQILCRLVKNKKLIRVARGIFARPQNCVESTINVLPEPSEIVTSISKSTGESIAINGAEAANQLQLTTQVPTTPVFLTSGTTRHVRVGNMEIKLKHVTPRKIVNTNTKAGLVISALWYLGKKQMNKQIIEKIKNKLSQEELQQLRNEFPHIPGWMTNAFHQYGMYRE